jgi:hypothetical protein
VEGPAVSTIPLATLHGSATFPFVIPSEAEGSAVFSVPTEHKAKDRGQPHFPRRPVSRYISDHEGKMECQHHPTVGHCGVRS